MSTGWIPEPTEGSRHGKTLRPTAGPLVPEEGLWVQVLRCESEPRRLRMRRKGQGFSVFLVVGAKLRLSLEG